MINAVGKINNQPDDKPDNKSYPGNTGERRHQEYATGYTQKRGDWVKWDLEGAVP